MCCIDQSVLYCRTEFECESICFRWFRHLWPLRKGSNRCHQSHWSPAAGGHHPECSGLSTIYWFYYGFAFDLIWALWVTFTFFGWQHALRLSAFGQLHKVLGMDPLPSKMPRKPRSETPIDYTGKTEWEWTFFFIWWMFCCVTHASILKEKLDFCHLSSP